MKALKAILFAALISSSAFAAGNVQQSISQLGNTNTWVLSFSWTADTNGTVPQTLGQTGTCCQGYNVSVVEIVPGTPSPTAGYAVAIQDGAGVDVLGGAAVGLSVTAAQSYPASLAAAPVQGALRLVITGQAVNSAKGIVYVFLTKPGQISAWNQKATASAILALENALGVSVTQFGVIADGTGVAGTDQTAKIQAAANAATGSTLIFPAAPFCYVVWAAVVIPSNTTVQINKGACVQKKFGGPPTCAPGCTAIFSTGTAPSVATSEIHFTGGGTIDGNKANITGISGDGFNVNLVFVGCTNCGAENLTIKDAWTDNVRVDCAGASSNIVGSGVRVAHNVITGARRANTDNDCGINSTWSENYVAGATGGSLSLGMDVEPFTAGQFVTGLTLEGNEFTGNRDGGINIAAPYDLDLNVTLINNNCHDNGGIVCSSFGNFNNAQPGGTVNGSLTLIGGSFVGGTVATMNIQGFSTIGITNINSSGSPRGILLCGSCSPSAPVNGPALITGSRLSGSVFDISTLSPVTLVLTTLVHGTYDSGADTTLLTKPQIGSLGQCFATAFSGTADCAAATRGASLASGSPQSVTINTTAVTATSVISLTAAPSLAGIGFASCGLTFSQPYEYARVPGVSFTVRVSVPTAGDGACFTWTVAG